MILGVRACTSLSGITSRTRQTHRTPGPWDRGQVQGGDPPVEQHPYPGGALGDGADDLAPVLGAGAKVLAAAGLQRGERCSALAADAAGAASVEQAVCPAQPVLSAPRRPGHNQPGPVMVLASGDQHRRPIGRAALAFRDRAGHILDHLLAHLSGGRSCRSLDLPRVRDTGVRRDGGGGGRRGGASGAGPTSRSRPTVTTTRTIASSAAVPPIRCSRRRRARRSAAWGRGRGRGGRPHRPALGTGLAGRS
jgi:hypothetical protein